MNFQTFFYLPQALRARGYERLVLQVGRGALLPAADSCPNIKLEAFRFKSSIAEDIKQADLVISHAGEQNIKSLEHTNSPMCSTLSTPESNYHLFFLKIMHNNNNRVSQNTKYVCSFPAQKILITIQNLKQKQIQVYQQCANIKHKTDD